MEPDALEYDAVILAGGRSSRLGGRPKHRLTYDGATLLQRSLDAAGGAGASVVVGPDPGVLPAGVISCREEPPFAGPAAAVAAGLAALAGSGAVRPLTLVLACDMPNVGMAVHALREALQLHGPPRERNAPHPPVSSRGPQALGPDGVMAVSADGRRQPLVGFYSTPALERSMQDLRSRGALTNSSMTALLASLDVQLVTVPAGSTDDVDTWDDAAALGVASQEP
ncbi:molybdopterin-guanine dinucleotide biosynthesis protein A [Arthrobacter pascens]|uniref:molybdenum cofactor guanylyltransferase n=1 Tax=Arthrobacter pascens TaxID=1677 RepID=UPI002791F344|nr:NTP transferase domain-containing protein [Arthrobacter pascens]MDQ0679942.1 molybdopterin-guanine dinucleotide biosynthesis protein A [Arthrobacter pascens]